jgi:hypothetical protein
VRVYTSDTNGTGACHERVFDEPGGTIQETKSQPKCSSGEREDTWPRQRRARASDSAARTTPGVGGRELQPRVRLPDRKHPSRVRTKQAQRKALTYTPKPESGRDCLMCAIFARQWCVIKIPSKEEGRPGLDSVSFERLAALLQPRVRLPDRLLVCECVSV